MVESLHSWRQWAWRWLSSDRPGTANVNGQATCAGRHRGYSETRDILNWLEIRMFETAGPTAQTAGTCIVAEHGRKIASAGLPRSRMSGPRVICAVSRVSGGGLLEHAGKGGLAGSACADGIPPATVPQRTDARQEQICASSGHLASADSASLVMADVRHPGFGPRAGPRRSRGRVLRQSAGCAPHSGMPLCRAGEWICLAARGHPPSSNGRGVGRRCAENMRRCAPQFAVWRGAAIAWRCLAWRCSGSTASLHH